MASDASLRCPRCLSLNSAGTASCRQCGAPLAPGAPPAAWSPSTLFLTGIWLVLGPGVLMPLFFLSPWFLAGPGASFRLLGSAVYFVVAAAVLGWITVRYFRRG